MLDEPALLVVGFVADSGPGFCLKPQEKVGEAKEWVEDKLHVGKEKVRLGVHSFKAVGWAGVCATTVAHPVVC